MRSSLRFVLASLFLSTLLAPASAFAGDAEKEAQPKAEDPTAGLKGFELMLRPSFGGAPSDSPVRFKPDAGVTVGDPGALMQGAAPWGPGFVGQASVGYRFLPFLSAGLRAGLRTTSASNNLTDGSSNLSRKSWDAGFYVRGYPLAGVESISKYVDPWIGTGIGYMRDTQSFQRSVATSGGGSVQADVSLDHHAIAIPIAIGVDYRVTKFLSLGPSFEYTIASAQAACAKTSAAGFQGSTYCSNESPGSKFVSAESYGVWSAGLDAKLTF